MPLRGFVTALTVTVAGIAALFAIVTPAHAADPIVVCDGAHNENQVDFNTGSAHVKATVYTGCVSVSNPSIVIGRVQPVALLWNHGSVDHQLPALQNILVQGF